MMSTEIYYFSASGNSLALGRDLAGRLSARLVAIPSVIQHAVIRPEADAIGLVFPVYYANMGGSGVPRIVRRFVAQLDGLAVRYVFAVCTHGGEPASTMENLGRMIAARDGRLAAGFTVKMGIPQATGAKLAHVLFGKPLPVEETPQEADERGRLATAAQEKLEVICERVGQRAAGPVETRSRAARLARAPLAQLQRRAGLARYRQLAGVALSSLEELAPLADRSFFTDERCRGCGTCARVCPVGNIRLVDGRPVWQHDCETCYACFQWCPSAAIHGAIVEYERRMHHPSVTLGDMVGAAAGEASRARVDG